MKLLISGGRGYLGGRLAQFIASSTSHEIILGTRRHTFSPCWLPQAKVVQTQWEENEALERICSGIDVVIHLAGMNAQDCALNSTQALEFNGVVTSRLLNAAIKQDVKRFIYLSTAHVYGSPLVGVISEANCPLSLHPYATSHRAGEDVIRSAHQRKEIEGIVIRLSNSFGAPVHRDVNCWMLLVNDLCRQAVTTKKLVLKSSGMQTRDFITMTDVCRAITHLSELENYKLGDGLYNVGGAATLTILEMTKCVADRVSEVMGFRPEIVCEGHGRAEKAEPLDYRVDKITGTGFGLYGNFDDEIDRLITFCRECFC